MSLKIHALLLIAVVLLLSGCTSEPESNVAQVQGTWQAPNFMVTDCSPEAVCAAAGFEPGTTRAAVLVLTQDRNELTGTYSYQTTPVSIPVSGLAGATVIAVSGATTIPQGSITVNVSGTLSGDSMAANVTHQVTLTDGRAANITGNGTFTR